MRRTTISTLLLVLAHGAGTGAALAQPGGKPAAPTAESVAAAAAEAKELNKQGIALLDAGDLERALEHFVRSRKVLATTKNTTNAAIVLDRLGRYDESLELYEELLLQYAGGLDDDDRAAIAPAMAELRGKVGSVAVASSAGGDVFIDGRPRGRLPLATAIRVLPGRHAVRVVRSGYADATTEVEVGAGQTVAVDATLKALEGVGQLVVEEVEGGAASVFVDGVKMGQTPWEGSVPPGEHLLWLGTESGLGTGPAWVRVVGKQSTLVRLQAKPLGPTIDVRVEPKTANVEVDGVAVGAGAWSGRLPVGSHEVALFEPGYDKDVRRVTVAPGASPIEIHARLKVDPSHPRWPKPEGSFLVEVYGGPLVGPTLAGDYDAGCPERCASSSVASGFQIGARGGYRFPVGVAIEVGGGYLSLRQSIERTVTDTFGDDDTVVTYALRDEPHVRGPFFTVAGSYRRALGNFYAGARGTIGVLVATSTDPVVGSASTQGPSAPIDVQRVDAVVSAAPFLGPEVTGGLRLGAFDVGLSLGVSWFPAEGGRLDRGRVSVEGDPVADPSAVVNARESNAIADELAYGPFWVFSPALTASTTF